MKNNQIILKSWFFIVSLIFSCKLVAIEDKIINYTCEHTNKALFTEKGRACCYKFSDDITYLLVDKFKLGIAKNTSDNQEVLLPSNTKENKHIALLVPTKKNLLVDFNDSTTSKITSKDVAIKDLSFIADDCISFLDLYRNVTSVCSMKHEFKTLDDSLVYCSYIMSEILTVLKQKKTLLFLPVLIPAIASLEKTRELLPLAYIDSIEQSYNDPNKIIFNLIILKVSDRVSPIQELSNESYLHMITTQMIQNRARYQINLNTGKAVFDLITSNDIEISIKEDLLSLHF
jgi:hypothetical protein